MPGPEGFTVATALARLAHQADQPHGLFALGAASLAGVLILVSCFVRTILPLRLLAFGSNLGFMLYGLFAPSPMTFVLHALLLPLNGVRSWQMYKLTRNVRRAAAAGEHADDWLTPYMKQRRLPAGATLFARGDAADKLYYLLEGRIELVELGREVERGRLFGEIAFFAADRRRTATARCLTPCTVLMLAESTFKQLYYQNPDFGFHVVRLIAGRLGEDIRRLEGRTAAGGGPT